MCVTSRLAVILSTLVATAACASPSSAPPGYLPKATAAQAEAFGAWVDFNYSVGTRVERFRGELLAVDVDSLWALSREHVLLAIPHSTVRDGRLNAYDSDSGTVGGLAFVGTLSTVSNGVFLIFTAPMWIIGGISASYVQANYANREVGELEWLQLAAFARFPGGLPEGLDRASLRFKALTPP